MSATPRVSSGAYPQTPGPGAALPSPSPTPPPRRRVNFPSSRTSTSTQPPSSSSTTTGRPSLPLAPEPTQNQQPAGSQPRIPLHIIDAPKQRAYALGLYVLLLAWKLYDWVRVVEDSTDNTESFWLWLKWLAIDVVFIFGLPELRIPWLELSQPVTLVLYFLHAWFDYMLMFNIPIPWMSWLLMCVKVFYDRGELSISESYVRSSTILNNATLIQGRQVINILPEGSAVLNPERTPFCIGPDSLVASIPLQFNSTVPREVEIVRTDLAVGAATEEVLKLSRSQLRTIENLAKKAAAADGGSPATVLFELPVKKTGAYKLRKVLDEYKLEVQRNSPHTLVVSCPSVSFGPADSAERCVNDLTDTFINVDGTPPLKIVYSRTVNGKDHSFHFQSIQPDGFTSPLTGTSSSLTLGEEMDHSWARSQRVRVPLNEALSAPGDWQYSVDEVQDAFGNVVKYTSPAEDPESRPKPKPKHLVKDFLVQERPKVRLEGCDIRRPIKVARGDKFQLPIAPVSGRPDDRIYTLTWDFSPIDSLTKSGDPGEVVESGTHTGKLAESGPYARYPGLYTLKSVTAGSCEGEVQEPSSCLVLNPPQPELEIKATEIPDTCAGNSLGLLVDLELTGTPPFVVHYEVVTNGDRRRDTVRVPGSRFQLEFIPRVAGTHKYIFRTIDDQIYKGLPLIGPEMTLEQNVKPAASAWLSHSGAAAAGGSINACLDEEVDLDVHLSGEPPFALEYAIIREDKRTTYNVDNIDSLRHAIRTPPLSQGGEYTLALSSVQDKRGCRNSLQSEAKISVRRQRPRAGFGVVDGKRRTLSMESAKTKLPLRLTGVGPWTVTYRNRDQADKAAPSPVRVQNSNDFLTVLERGVYEILSVSDNQCQGSVDPKAAEFEVDWIPRPELSLVEAESISSAGDNKFVKKDVCEGDIDGFEILLRGSPPFHVEYKVHHKPLQGSASSIGKQFDVVQGKAAVSLDTGKPGQYTYTFDSLSDNLYTLNKKQFKALVLSQRVNAKPTARFDKPGQTFKYCASEEQAGGSTTMEDAIPITLTGVAPFFVELEIKHHSGVVAQVHHVTSIHSHSYGVRIPRDLLRLGSQQVRIREVRDARGCQSRIGDVANGQKGGLSSASVNVHLYDAPAIYPLETREDYCVGDRIAYTLSGTPPFEVTYTFGGVARRADSATTSFRRMADSPGEFAITSVRDRASECRASVQLVKTVHPLPSVRISRGRNVQVDIHEGGEVEILFEFGGTPPFEFTYTRSTNARKGVRPQVLETRHDVSHEHTKVVRASQEGTYEVVAIKDRYCAFSTQQNVAGGDKKDGGGRIGDGGGQKLLS